MAEICNKCGKTIKLKCEFEMSSNLFENEFYCNECYDKVSREFYLSD